MRFDHILLIIFVCDPPHVCSNLFRKIKNTFLTGKSLGFKPKIKKNLIFNNIVRTLGNKGSKRLRGESGQLEQYYLLKSDFRTID